MRKFPLIISASAWLALAVAPAIAADAGAEISTAAAHAGMAAGAPDPQLVKTHLHHVLNCLEGPTGSDFDAAPGNPCKALGNGAIPDSTEAGRKPLEAAAELAREGLGASDVAKAKAKASEVQTALSR